MTHFQEEIYAQPDILTKILQDGQLQSVGEQLRERSLRLILTLARGSSDNAVTFFSYLAGQYLGVPVASLPPSLFSVYASSMVLQDALAIAVSQSGESSDVIEGLKSLRQSGAVSISVSNQADSRLGRVADYSLEQHAGAERAVAASKTFSSQMMVLAVLVAHWSQNKALWQALEQVPDRMQAILAQPEAIEKVALRLTHAESLYILGRGLSYGPALELALKLKETSYVHAQAYSSAEFQHGPIAAVDAHHPIILLGTADATLESNRQVAQRLVAVAADLTVVSSALDLLQLSKSFIALPGGLSPVTEAFLQVLVGQLLALHLTLSKGLNPDAPRHLTKITKTM